MPGFFVCWPVIRTRDNVYNIARFGRVRFVLRARWERNTTRGVFFAIVQRPGFIRRLIASEWTRRLISRNRINDVPDQNLPLGNIANSLSINNIIVGNVALCSPGAEYEINAPSSIRRCEIAARSRRNELRPIVSNYVQLLCRSSIFRPIGRGPRGFRRYRASATPSGDLSTIFAQPSRAPSV